MSAFESISTPAAQPAPAPATAVTVNVGRRHGIIAAVCCLVLAGGGYWEGRVDGSARYEAEHARFETYIADERDKAATEKARQADALRDVQAASDLRAEQSATATTDLQGRIDVYVAQLQRRPVSDRCTLTDADLHGLRDLSPGAAPRARHRPTAAARDTEVVR
ncbi:hypothetical protein D3273_26230 [Lichenibacterium minor]|uniref:Uncharacterized protein n=1 Tax=Lichenibacterium minor TaxID=2316528 RepID=A0A4Q2U2U3_9HYPH|nr:hypothetical protein [Lichenibacterium minor]RYC29015.1 hypothetical protein D3273_26230 [Lichenibacterium minor]